MRRRRAVSIIIIIILKLLRYGKYGNLTVDKIKQYECQLKFKSRSMCGLLSDDETDDKNKLQQ